MLPSSRSCARMLGGRGEGPEALGAKVSPWASLVFDLRGSSALPRQKNRVERLARIKPEDSFTTYAAAFMDYVFEPVGLTPNARNDVFLHCDHFATAAMRAATGDPARLSLQAWTR